jgi:hypothetical protein
VATNHVEIAQWLAHAKAEGASHMLVVCDGFDYEDYPVLVMPGEDVEKKVDEYNALGMQNVMEVYHMQIDLAMQLGQVRAWNAGPWLEPSDGR